MTTKHTPGPWSRGLDNQERNIIRSLVKGVSPRTIATLRSERVHSAGSEEDDANARLIALAPEMADLLALAAGYEADKFDGRSHELNVSGADLVDWFTAWREEVKAALAKL